MRRAAKGWHSRGYLPHFDSPEIIQHLVLRAADSLPAAVASALPEDSPLRLEQLDAALDLGHGAGLLKQAGPAAIVETAMLHIDGARYRLIAWSVMPNYFDRFIRNEAHFHRTIDYIEQNAVKAGLASEPADWRFSSVRRLAERSGL